MAFIWPKITDHRISKGKFYSDEIINLIGIKPEERADFFKEMLIDRKFQYYKFIGHYEKILIIKNI